MKKANKIDRKEFTKWMDETSFIYTNEPVSDHLGEDANLWFLVSPKGELIVRLGEVILYRGKSFKAAAHAYETA